MSKKNRPKIRGVEITSISAVKAPLCRYRFLMESPLYFSRTEQTDKKEEKKIMKTSFRGSKILFASAFVGLLVSLCSVISTTCLKYSSQINRWNVKYEVEKQVNNSLNEKQINAVN